MCSSVSVLAPSRPRARDALRQAAARKHFTSTELVVRLPTLRRIPRPMLDVQRRLKQWSQSIDAQHRRAFTSAADQDQDGELPIADITGTRLQKLLQLQQRVLNGALPSATERASAAWSLILDDGDVSHAQGFIKLSPEELLRVLEEVAFCPAFSLDLFAGQGPINRYLFLNQDAFEGSSQLQELQQFFRNQIFCFFLEKAKLIHSAFDCVTVESFTAERRQHTALRGMLNRIHCGEDVDEDDVDGGGDGAVSDGRDRGIIQLVDFTLESERYPYLVAWGKGDLFLIHRADVANELGLWFLGETQRVVAPPAGPVSVLELLIFPLRSSTSDLHEAEMTYFDLVPLADFLPSVFNRQIRVLQALCEGSGCFHSFVRDLVFRRVGKSVACGQEVALCSDTDVHSPSAASKQVCCNTSTDHLNDLNEQQKIAVETAVNSGPLTLVEGPPGTGKTTVAVAIVHAWLAQDAETPILVATGTHTAKNLLAERLRISGLRLSDRRGKHVTHPDASPIFVETVFMAAYPPNRSLPRVLLDESTQITEAATLVALAQGCCQLVLIGDPNQLGPVSTLLYEGPGRDPELMPYELERTSFYELMLQRHEVTPVRLNIQHRMHPQLSQYPAQRFYQGALQDAPSNFKALPRNFPFWWGVHGTDEEKSVVFVDTKGHEQALEESVPAFNGSMSWQNQLEANVLACLIARLAAAGIQRTDIAVLTSYGAQRDCIVEALNTVRPGQGVLKDRVWKRRAQRALYGDLDPFANEPHPRVFTIDGFQGSESDFVLFSAVRANPHCQPGFVGARRRLCVMLTRARRGLVVVGDSGTLEGDAEWRSWLQDASKHWIPATEILRLCEGC